MSQPKVVLAFSGGLDTSFCVPWLAERGYDVYTLFVDTGGVSDAEVASIEARAAELGAAEHRTVNAGAELWSSFVVPFVMGGARYQGAYPLLCSDRYAICAEAARWAHEIGAVGVAHGCTAMGNDQFRFDQSVRSLSDLPIIAPVREIQGQTDNPRRFELDYLKERGHDASAAAKRYTINENLLGVTLSGSEIDDMAPPSEEARRITARRSAWPSEPMRARIGFERGVPVSLDDQAIGGVDMLATLNQSFGAYGVGWGLYTGDTIVGLKGRIVFESPGLDALLAAHGAIEALTLTKRQREAKGDAARTWTEMVFGGLFFDPAREDLEALIRSSQRLVTGEVLVETTGGVCHAVAVDTSNALVDDGAVYAQRAGWSAADAEGFVKILGNGSALGATVVRRQSSSAVGAS